MKNYKVTNLLFIKFCETILSLNLRINLYLLIYLVNQTFHRLNCYTYALRYLTDYLPNITQH